MSGDPLLLLLLASALVVVSYLFDALARVSRVPSVLLLLGLGVGLRLAADAAGVPVPLPAPLIIILGTLGLILIVLEGALELSVVKEKLPLIRRAGGAALLVLVLTALALALLLVAALDVPLRTALLNALPFAVISSAIAIPGSSGFDPAKREFIVYESTFSDILGIMLFTALLPSPFSGSVAWQAGNLLGVVVLAAVGSLLLMLMVEKITTHIKFFLILAVLTGVYVIAKQLHLSALLLVLVFGLLLNNSQAFSRFPLRGLINVKHLRHEVRQFRVIVLESAFLVRTFFFVAFGFYLELGGLLRREVIGMAVAITGIIVLARYLHLRHVARCPLLPELFIAPRGLITVLLFLQIPAAHRLPLLPQETVFLVVAFSGLLMLSGTLAWKKPVELPDDLL